MSGQTYKASGVDVERDNAFSKQALRLASSTFTDGVRWAGDNILAWPITAGMKSPGLITSGDGVGTKPMYAILMGRHSLMGWDLVMMNVNDLVRYNAIPFLFLDYLGATPSVSDKDRLELLSGVVEGCKASKCSLVGGETASMPGWGKDYKLVGFAVGVVDEQTIIDGTAIREGDVVFGLPSSGPHDNGYSLIREVFPPEEAIHDPVLIDQILQPTRNYSQRVLDINRQFAVHGWAHITGSGIVGKLGDILPDGLQAKIFWGNWPVHEIFTRIQEVGRVSDGEMRRTFNLGLGMIGVASESEVHRIIYHVQQYGEKAYIVGKVVADQGKEKVV